MAIAHCSRVWEVDFQIEIAKIGWPVRMQAPINDDLRGDEA